MKCYNCLKDVPANAVRCRYCEADLRREVTPSPEEMAEVKRHLESVAPGALEAIGQMARQYETSEEFANAVFVGSCPACDSEHVGTFEEVKGVEDPTVARCFDCGHLWCSECREPLSDPKAHCGHWDVCNECGKEEDCPYLGDAPACPKIRNWRAGRKK